MPKALRYNRAITCFNSDLICSQKTDHGKEDTNIQLHLGHSQKTPVLTFWANTKNWGKVPGIQKVLSVHVLSTKSQLLLHSAPWDLKVLSPETKITVATCMKKNTGNGLSESHKHCCWRKLVCRASLMIRSWKVCNTASCPQPSSSKKWKGTKVPGWGLL